MALMDPLQGGPIDSNARFQLRIGGAESNFAIALSRLGVPVTWISRVGRDAFGDLILKMLASEGVVVDQVKVDPFAPTAIYFKVRERGRASVFYYRQGSAASRMEIGDVSEDAWADVKLVHLTGITMAISSSARELVIDTARKARAHGATVVFDPNYRPALWSTDEASAAYRSMLPYADWYLSGLDECQLLFGAPGVAELFGILRDSGVKGVVLRDAERGALIDTGEGPVAIEPTRIEEVVDEIGAGDGFAAGFAFGLLRSLNLAECVGLGNRVAACALRGTGDWETYPYLLEIEPILPEGKP